MSLLNQVICFINLFLKSALFSYMNKFLFSQTDECLVSDTDEEQQPSDATDKILDPLRPKKSPHADGAKPVLGTEAYSSDSEPIASTRSSQQTDSNKSHMQHPSVVFVNPKGQIDSLVPQLQIKPIVDDALGVDDKEPLRSQGACKIRLIRTAIERLGRKVKLAEVRRKSMINILQSTFDGGSGSSSDAKSAATTTATPVPASSPDKSSKVTTSDQKHGEEGKSAGDLAAGYNTVASDSNERKAGTVDQKDPIEVLSKDSEKVNTSQEEKSDTNDLETELSPQAQLISAHDFQERGRNSSSGEQFRSPSLNNTCMESPALKIDTAREASESMIVSPQHSPPRPGERGVCRLIVKSFS